MNFGERSLQELQLRYSVDINPATGAVEASIPIPVSQGRKSFQPELTLQYLNSRARSPFGNGWALSGAPSITMDAKKGHPKYDGTDTYAFMGEALIPLLENKSPKRISTVNFDIYYFRAHSNNTFDRFEKWVNKISGNIHWKLHTTSNSVFVFGEHTETQYSAIANPALPHQVYSWLVDQAYDNSGNAMYYYYKPEDNLGVNTALSYERERIHQFNKTGFAQRYLTSIKYGNTSAVYPDQQTQNLTFLFELHFDYGEFSRRPYILTANNINPWQVRKDPYSNYQAGFEIRNYRLCRRILMYHTFSELGPEPSLVSIFQLDHEETDSMSILKSCSFIGIHKDVQSGIYREKAMPPISFDYAFTQADQHFVANIQENNEAGMYGINTSKMQIIDLYNNGFPGILLEYGDNWYYKENLTGGKFGPTKLVHQKPKTPHGEYALGDFTNSGMLQYFVLQGREAGYFEYLHERETWSEYKNFKQILNASNPVFFDINGDGNVDLILEHEDKYSCYQLQGKRGFDKSIDFPKHKSTTNNFSHFIGEHIEISFFLADMTGDGLPDQVIIKNGSISYFPNLGNGRFGDPITMKDAPTFDFNDAFDTSRIRLFDLDGSGTSDIIYIGRGEINYWYNASGNTWIKASTILNTPYFNQLGEIKIGDVLLNGTACLYWTNPVALSHNQAFHYLQLNSNLPQGTLIGCNNGMGLNTTFEFGYSAQHFLSSRLEGKAWNSSIPFHFFVVDQQIVFDAISKHKLVKQYKYADGHYNPADKIFICFGFVEQYESQLFGSENAQNPQSIAEILCTKTWIHSGMLLSNFNSSRAFYNKDLLQEQIPQCSFENNIALHAEEFCIAYALLAGKVYRSEVFAVDKNGILHDTPIDVNQYNFCIRKLQDSYLDFDPCFFVYDNESLSYHYADHANDPHITHDILTQVNEFGFAEITINIAYARRSTNADREPEQQKDYIIVQQSKVSHINTESDILINIPLENNSFEITGLLRNENKIFKSKDLQLLIPTLIIDCVIFDAEIQTSNNTARCISWSRNFYWNNKLTETLEFGQVSPLALVHHSETACFTNNMINIAYENKLDIEEIKKAKYIFKDDYWWIPSEVHYFTSADTFYLEYQKSNVYGNFASIEHDSYWLFLIKETNAFAQFEITHIDYNLLLPCYKKDINDNIQEIIYDPLGIPIATFNSGSLIDEADQVQLYGNGVSSDYQQLDDISFENILDNPMHYLQQAATIEYYEPLYDPDKNKAFRSIAIHRTSLIHNGTGQTMDEQQIQIIINYEDAFGRIIQTKTKLHSGEVVKRDQLGLVVLDTLGNPEMEESSERWLTSGYTQFNNKSLVTRQFEPYFSNLSQFEPEDQIIKFGTSTTQYYNAIGDLIKIENPNGSFSEGVFTAWSTFSFDENDTVDRSTYKDFREFLPDSNIEKIILNKSLKHSNTPIIEIRDPLQRVIKKLHHNNNNTSQCTITKFDILGNPIQIKDSRNILAFRSQYDMLGRIMKSESADAGTTYTFHSPLNEVLQFWNSNNYVKTYEYDALHRLTSIHISGNAIDHVVEKLEYGENLQADYAKSINALGRLIRHYDQAGVESVLRYAPDGSALKTSRRLASETRNELNWKQIQSVPLESIEHISTKQFDAIGRILEQEFADGSTHQYNYDLLGDMTSLSYTSSDGKLTNKKIIKSTSRDARGLRQSLIIGNQVAIKYKYDPQTYRLTQLKSTSLTTQGKLYQDIQYAYDPIGNVMYTNDSAQQANSAPHVMQGLKVSAHTEFEYDALYQLTSASGRVHQSLLQHDHAHRSNDTQWTKGTRHLSLNNAAAVERYTKTYQHDLNGNLLQIKHLGKTIQWTDAFIVDPKSNRRITKFDNNGIPSTNTATHFDNNGNQIKLDHVHQVDWNYNNQIKRVILIDRSSISKFNDEEWYVYTANGARIKKISQRIINVQTNQIELIEKTYLDGFEIKRIIAGNSTILERFSNHISDGTQKIASIYRWNKDSLSKESEDISKAKIHYQLNNHLGSASLELDEEGKVISYEEYFPHGGTAFIAGRNIKEIELKEYRYSGKERDDLTGLYYFGYRYYAHWIGGWMNPDPIGPEDALNLYLYVHNNPVNIVDPNGLKGDDEKFKTYTQQNSIEQYKQFYLGKIIETESGEKKYVTYVDAKLEMVNGEEILQPYVKTVPFTADTKVSKKTGKVILGQPEDPSKEKNKKNKSKKATKNSNLPQPSDSDGKGTSTDELNSDFNQDPNLASEASTDFGNDAKKQDGNSEDGQDVGIPNDNNENAPPPKIKRYNTNEKKLNLGGGTGTGWYSSDRRELDFGDMPEYLDFLKPVAAVVKSLAENFIIEPVKLFFDVTVIPIINISLWAMDDPSRVNYLSGIGQAISAGLGPKEILKAAVLGILESGMKASKAFKEGDATTFAYEFTNIWSAVFDASRSVGGGLKHVNDLRIKRGLHNAKEMINDSTTIDPLNTEISYVNFEKRNKGLKMYGKFVTMREKQVAAMQKKVNKHNVIKDKHYNPDWEYRHDQIPESEGAVWKGCYSAGANKIIIFETAFALPLTSRLPDLYPGSNNYLFSKTGILTFLKGVTEEKTGYHEAYHSVQFKTDPKFYNESSIGIKIQTPNGEIPIYKQYHHRPVEFTQPRLRAPFEGAHNVAAWHGPITDMTYFFFILFPISNMLGNYIEQRY